LQYGYKIPLPHWLAFLRSPACQHFVNRLLTNREKYLRPEHPLGYEEDHGVVDLDREGDPDAETAERQLWKHPLPPPKKGVAAKDPHTLALKRKTSAAGTLVAQEADEEGQEEAALVTGAVAEKKKRKRPEKKQPAAAAAAAPKTTALASAISPRLATSEDYYAH